ncbi:cystatin domain-containing protein [Aeromonas schubertii]|uniref:Cystatin domain-containing protein n=1 Tax=Aeromonas schubertii TaxID=652 RepID=A0A0S2SEI9_9GAMM|nr:cystatin domain-containing protein [Aeromonas schubertii]ALP40118.1 hypothetical protein WL1483_699 [Aeromonas schubertii]MBZ6073469.1 hypothetical protein [Aeromonas schubertii]
MKTLIAILFGSLLGACSQAPQPLSCDPVPGGWQSMPQPDAEAKAALAHVLAQMNTSAHLKGITRVDRQVVAGINYDIEFMLDTGEMWNTRVYRTLQGEYRMTRPARQGALPAICPRN